MNKKMSIPTSDIYISNPKGKESYQRMVLDDGLKHIKAKKIDHRVQPFPSKSNQISKNESKVIFVNPERFNISTIKKSLNPRRVVIPSNISSVESNNSSTRKVFINPNFEQPFREKILEKPCQENSFSNQHFQTSIESQKPKNSLSITVKQSVAKTSLGNEKSHLTLDFNNFSNQKSQTVVKAKSCYINPHFKGLIYQEGKEHKRDILKHNENVKEQKCLPVSQRIVKFGKAASTASEISSVIQINTSKTIQNPVKGIVSTESTLNQKGETIFKSGKFKDNENEHLRIMKVMKNCLPCPQLEKVKISRNLNILSTNLCSKNVNTKNEKCPSEIVSNYSEPKKIYFNKEKWKNDISKMNKVLLNTQESNLTPKESPSKSTTKQLEHGRNIFVNRSLLVKRLKETDLNNTLSASTSNLFTQKQNCADLLKEKQTIINPTKQIMCIKPTVLKQRKRSSSSTCLISISKTKMVRKKKALVHNAPLKHVKKHLPENLNKLRKLEIFRTRRNTRQVIQPIIRNNIHQFINPNKMSISRKHSFMQSINNSVTINPNYRKNEMNKINGNFHSVALKNNCEFKKSKYYLNKTKVNKLNTAKNRPIKTLSTNKSIESMGKGSRKLVRSNSSLLILTPTKLVRKKLPFSQHTLSPCKTLSSLQLARLIKSKYKFNRSLTVLKKSLLSGNKISSNRKTRKNEIHNQNIIGKRKIHFQKSSIVNIGGVFYKATRNKLTRNSAVSNKAGINKGPILQVRGQRFSLDKTGRTLKSLDARLGVNKLKRVDIGGVTFIQSKQGTSLVRTNTHNARTRLIQAKQRSITLLTKNLRKNNEPCPLYHRFGRCIGKERGTCNRIHNSKNIAVCKKFVQGKCENTNCLLSHAIGPEKMPTCYHYLAGNCVRDNCPYLHVKVNSKAPVCVAFLQGYCADGDKCKKRHKDVCPEFEENGTCTKGKFCPYPHPKRKKNPKPRAANVEKVEIEVPKEVSTFRYFDEEQCHEDVEDTESVQETIHNDKREEVSDWLVKRPKLGMLPAFIPLNME